MKETVELLGGLDVVISNAVSDPTLFLRDLLADSSKGWTKMTAFNDLDSMTDEDWDKVLTITSPPTWSLF